MNANLKAETVDQLLEHRKTRHIAAFGHEIKVLECRLKTIAKKMDAESRMEQDRMKDEKIKVSDFLDRIIEQCKEVLSRHKAVPIRVYNNS